MMVHAAISGSTNTLLHLPAIAREFGVELDADSFDRMHRGAHYLLDIRPAGRLARGILLLRRGRAPHHGGDQVHAPSGCDDRHWQDPGREPGGLQEKWLLRPPRRAAAKTGLRRTDIIRTFEEPIGTNGTIAVLKGNLAPQRQRGQAQRRAQEMHSKPF